MSITGFLPADISYEITHQVNLHGNSTGFEINACPRPAEIASDKLVFVLTCPTGKLAKYSVLNIKQDYLEMQFSSAFVAVK